MAKTDDVAFGTKHLWDALKHRLKEAGIDPQTANKTIRNASSLNYARPMYGQVHLLLNLLEVNMADFLAEEERLQTLSPNQENMLTMFSSIAITDQEILMAILMDLTGKVFVNISPNPKFRLKYFLAHSAYDDSTLNAQFARIPKCKVPDYQAAGWCIGNAVRLASSTLSISMEEIVQIAAILEISPRWLCGFDTETSFWGYTPLTETLFDHWTLAPAYVQLIITNILKSFRLECTI